MAARGSFNLRPEGVRGGLTRPRAARLTASYRIAATGTAPACQGTLTWHLHPALRRRVQDGTWELRFSDGESETFRVDGGGREATGITFPSGFDCRLGGVDLFVGAGGRATWADGGTQVSLDFSRRSASGQMTGMPPPGSASSACSLAMTASLRSPAR